MTVNFKIIPYYKKAFKICCDFRNIDVKKTEIEKSVIICTTAWERTHIIDDEDLRVLRDVCNYLNSMGVRLFLKTHPRDKYFISKSTDLGCEILETKGFVLESIFSFATPMAVISFSSTTLVTANLIWNIPVFCLSKMLDRTKISSYYLNEIDGFYRTFKRNICFVDNLKDIVIKV